jgi:hypothetical protein
MHQVDHRNYSVVCLQGTVSLWLRIRHEFKNFVKISISLLFMQNRWYLLTDSRELQRSDPITRAAKTLIVCNSGVPTRKCEGYALIGSQLKHQSQLLLCMQIHFWYMEICFRNMNWTFQQPHKLQSLSLCCMQVEFSGLLNDAQTAVRVTGWLIHVELEKTWNEAVIA